MRRNDGGWRVVAWQLVIAMVLGSPAWAQSWSVAGGELEARCKMTVGGGFQAVGGGLSGSLERTAAEPDKLSGELLFDLTGVDTGIELRNKHLREKYLEVGKGEGYASARLSDITLAGAGAGELSGEFDFAGQLTVHGETRAVSGKARLEPAPGGVRVTAEFPLDLTQFGVESPRYLGVGVKDVVQVSVSFMAQAEGQ